MTPAAWIGAGVGLLAILATFWRGGKALFKVVSLFEALVADVAELKREFKNGIRTDILQAKDKATEAARLAGQTAQRVSLIEQRKDEDHADLHRSVNALRGEVDVYTNVVLTDRQRIWARLREAGINIADDDGGGGDDAA